MYDNHEDWVARWLHYYCVGQLAPVAPGGPASWHRIAAVDTRRRGEIGVCNEAGDRLYVCPTMCAQSSSKKGSGCNRIGSINVFNHPAPEGASAALQARKFQYLDPDALGENSAVVPATELLDFVKHVRTSIPAEGAGNLERRIRANQIKLRVDALDGMSMTQFDEFVAAVLPSQDCPAQAALRADARKLSARFREHATERTRERVALSQQQSKDTISVLSYGAGDWGGFCRPIRNGLGDTAKFSAVHHVVRFTGLVLDGVPELLDFVLRMQVQCESAGVFVVPRLAPGAPEPETTDTIPCTVWVEYACAEDARDVHEQFVAYSRGLSAMSGSVQSAALSSMSEPALFSAQVKCGCGHMFRANDKVGGLHNQFNVFPTHCKVACLLSPDACAVHEVGAFGGCGNFAHWQWQWKRGGDGGVNGITDVFLRDFVKRGVELVRFMFSARRMSEERDLVDYVMTTPASGATSTAGLLLMESFRRVAMAWPSGPTGPAAEAPKDLAVPSPPRSATSTPEGPTSTPKNLTSTPKNPTSTPESPTSTPEGPTSTPKNPTSTPKNPTSTPKNPTSAPESSTSKAASVPPPPPPTPVLGPADGEARVGAIQSLSDLTMLAASKCDGAAAHNKPPRRAGFAMIKGGRGGTKPLLRPQSSLSVLAAMATGKLKTVMHFGSSEVVAMAGGSDQASSDEMLYEDDSSDSLGETFVLDTVLCDDESGALSPEEISCGMELPCALPVKLTEMGSEDLAMFDAQAAPESDVVQVPRRVWEQMMETCERAADMVEDICSKQEAVNVLQETGVERKRRKVAADKGMATWSGIF
jgi:hypothetical protein